MQSAVLVAFGGALGALLRFWLSKAINFQFNGAFPYGTLFVNLLGCLSIGALYAIFFNHTDFNNWIKPLILIGILGGFTTFSSFSLEVFQMVQQNKFLIAAAYILASNLGGLTLTFLGYKLFSE